MNESSTNQNRPWWVRLAIYPSGRPREYHVLRCWLTVPVAIVFCLSVVIGFYLNYADALKVHPRWWVIFGIVSTCAFLGLLLSALLTMWLYYAVRWMDRNQQW